MEDSPSKRASRRTRGEDPITDNGTEDDTPLRELRMLTQGGKGGRPYDDSNKWNFFPEKSLTSYTEDDIVLHNSNIFSSIAESTDETKHYDNDRRFTDECKYQMIKMDSLESAINDQCLCRCSVDNEFELFFRHLGKKSSGKAKKYTVQDLKNLRNEYNLRRRKSKFQTNTLSLNCENIGLEAIVSIECAKCKTSSTIPNETTKFKGTNYAGDACNNENCSWYATNIRLVIGTLASGLGAADISCLFSFLGLPNLYSFCNRQYKRIETLIGKYFRQVANDSMHEARDIEVTLTQQQFKDQPVENWRSAENPVGLTLSYDMGWSKRSSGNIYNSLSGHSFLVGCHSKIILGAQVLSKQCSVCTSAESKGVTPRDHECPKNFTGSSKAMEAHAALSLVKELDEESDSRLYVEAFVTDDDTSIRALLNHDLSKNKTGKGKLPLHIPVPRWLADPSHRTRVVARVIFGLVTLRAGDGELKKVDALRFKRNYGYMLKQCRELTLEEFKIKVYCVIEHMFNNHLLCDSKWCKPLRMLEARDGVGDVSTHSNYFSDDSDFSIDSDDEETTMGKVSYYRCKTRHRHMYEKLIDAFEPYAIEDRLEESLHGFETQLNECLNSMVARYAPKNRTYGTTMSLKNRISIVVGTNNKGHFGYWKQIFKHIELYLGHDLGENLNRLDRLKEWKRKYNTNTETKRKRSQHKNEKLQELMKQQKNDADRGYIYESGYAIKFPVPNEVLKIEDKLRSDGIVTCNLKGCHSKKHKTNSSKQCKYYAYGKDADALGKAIDTELRELYSHLYYCRPVSED